MVLLPTIIKLFEDTTPVISTLGASQTIVQERAMFLFSYLIADNLELQTIAMEGDAIKKLANIILQSSVISLSIAGEDINAISILSTSKSESPNQSQISLAVNSEKSLEVLLLVTCHDI